MTKAPLRLLLSLTLFITVLAGAIFMSPGGLYGSTLRSEDRSVIIEKGMGVRQMANELANEGVILHPYLFLAAAYLSGQSHSLKPGEYNIPAEATPTDIVNLISSGKSIIHSITIPEGYTVSEIADKIQEINILKGDITQLPSEGYLLPETYQYVYGETKQELLNQMKNAMEKRLEAVWEKRSPNVPYNTPHEALVMASIVEKETGHASERPRVAAVFVNRLRVGMRLQADPTVIYGLTLGKQKLNRPLTKADLQSETPYNTYVIEGLPPHPIACPGAAALEATLNPSQTKELYFVADGQGNHNFSEDLNQHSTYVAHFRKSQKSS